VFRAQDDKGNVWHFGEVKEVYDENDKLIAPRSGWTEVLAPDQASSCRQASRGHTKLFARASPKGCTTGMTEGRCGRWARR